MMAARHEARKGFEQNRSLSSGEAVSQNVAYAEEIARILRENVVQGQASDEESGRYSQFDDNRRHSAKSLTRVPELRIHEHTEKGDNETIKLACKGTTLAGKCRSS